MCGSKQILITGGTGFIGRFVVRTLLSRGAKVRLLCRNESKAGRLFGDRVEIVVGDLLEPASCQQACRGMLTVIHLGGLYRFGRRHRVQMEAVNHRGTENMLQAAWDQRVERFVHVSSSSVLESANGLTTEDDFPRYVAAGQHYRRSKWLGERAALDWARRGFPLVVASPVAPLGPEDETPTPTGQMVLDFLRGRFPFATHTRLNIVHVGELAEGIMAVAERGRPGERYLLGHHDVTLAEFLRLLADCTAQNAPRFCLPWGMIALAGVVGESAGADRLCWETALHARRRARYSGRKAAEELGWQPSRPPQLTVSRRCRLVSPTTEPHRRVSGESRCCRNLNGCWLAGLSWLPSGGVTLSNWSAVARLPKLRISVRRALRPKQFRRLRSSSRSAHCVRRRLHSNWSPRWNHSSRKPARMPKCCSVLNSRTPRRGSLSLRLAATISECAVHGRESAAPGHISQSEEFLVACVGRLGRKDDCGCGAMRI